MPAASFFDELPPFDRFSELTDDRHFRPVPADWTVFVADIAGSTRAIEAGRYRDVNTVAAACIVAAHNAVRPQSFPYVFGGDGATLVVPPTAVDAVAGALAGVRALARARFDIELRVGAVPAGVLYRDGHAIEVARFRLVAGQAIAIFRGGGIAIAEERIKRHPDLHGVPDVSGQGDLQGLSCRWQPIPSGRGVVLSLIVRSRLPDARAGYDAVLQRLAEILDGDLEAANPVTTANLRYRTLRRLLADERRYHRRALSWAFVRRAAEIVGAVLVFGRGVPGVVFNRTRYTTSMRAHSDFRKFDDALRMVIDCTKDQAERVRTTLEERRRRGEIHYGLHLSDRALMTCFVSGLGDGEHVHFIDGGDGGYALAAKELKAQLRDGT